MNYDLAIVGLGAHGSSVLHRAAQAGLKVIGIDQFSPPHKRGSHYRDTRITRLSHAQGEPEGGHLAPIVKAGNSWRETFEEADNPLFVKTGYLNMADSRI